MAQRKTEHLSSIPMDARILYSGILMKKHEHRKQWQKRWFVLFDNRVISYYHNREEFHNFRRPIASIHLQDVTAIQPINTTTQTPQKKTKKSFFRTHLENRIGSRSKSRNNQLRRSQSHDDSYHSLRVSFKSLIGKNKNKPPPDSSLRNGTKLYTDDYIDCSHPSDESEFSFEISTTTHSYLLCCFDAYSLIDWLQYLRNATFGNKIHCGWLTKQQGARGKSWKKRWFVLFDTREIRYYGTEKATQEKGCIMLDELQIMKYITKKKNVFELVCSENKWVLMAQSKEERELWFNRVVQVVPNVQRLDPLYSNELSCKRNDLAKKWTKGYFAMDVENLFFFKTKTSFETFKSCAYFEEDLYRLALAQHVQGLIPLRNRKIKELDRNHPACYGKNKFVFSLKTTLGEFFLSTQYSIQMDDWLDAFRELYRLELQEKRQGVMTTQTTRRKLSNSFTKRTVSHVPKERGRKELEHVKNHRRKRTGRKETHHKFKPRKRSAPSHSKRERVRNESYTRKALKMSDDDVPVSPFNNVHKQIANRKRNRDKVGDDDAHYEIITKHITGGNLNGGFSPPVLDEGNEESSEDSDDNVTKRKRPKRKDKVRTRSVGEVLKNKIGKFKTDNVSDSIGRKSRKDKIRRRSINDVKDTKSKKEKRPRGKSVGDALKWKRKDQVESNKLNINVPNIKTRKDEVKPLGSRRNLRHRRHETPDYDIATKNLLAQEYEHVHALGGAEDMTSSTDSTDSTASSENTPKALQKGLKMSRTPGTPEASTAGGLRSSDEENEESDSDDSDIEIEYNDEDDLKPNKQKKLEEERREKEEKRKEREEKKAEEDEELEFEDYDNYDDEESLSSNSDDRREELYTEMGAYIHLNSTDTAVLLEGDEHKEWSRLQTAKRLQHRRRSTELMRWNTQQLMAADNDDAAADHKELSKMWMQLQCIPKSWRKDTTETRIVKEFMMFQLNHDHSIDDHYVIITNMCYPNIYQWNGYFVGPRGTPYVNGKYRICVTFSKLYPSKPPKITFLTNIYNSSVKYDKTKKRGLLKLPKFFDKIWSEKISLRQWLNVIYEFLFFYCGDHFFDPMNQRVARQFMFAFDSFIDTCYEWNLVFANAYERSLNMLQLLDEDGERQKLTFYCAKYNNQYDFEQYNTLKDMIWRTIRDTYCASYEAFSVLIDYFGNEFYYCGLSQLIREPHICVQHKVKRYENIVKWS